MPADGRLSLALDEARRSLDQQKADLASVRDRAGALFAVGGLVTSLLGGLAIRDGAEMSGWTWLGVVAFVATVIAALLVLWPWPFKFAVRATALVGWMENQQADLDTMTRDLALWSDSARTHNQRTLDRLWTAYTVGAVLLLIEIVALMLDLRGR